MIHLPEGIQVGTCFVHRFIKEGMYNHSYVVNDADGQPRFMKLFFPERVPQKLMEEDTPKEILTCRGISHRNIISYKEDGVIEWEGKKYPYLITPFFKGKLLSEILHSSANLSIEEALAIILPVLDGLIYLHNDLNLSHNDLTPRNILLEEQVDGSLVPKIIDLGHCYRPVFGAPPFLVDDLNLLYTAPEALKGFFSEKADVFSVAAILYHLLVGSAPWSLVLDENLPYSERKLRVREARKANLAFPEGMDDSLREALGRGLFPEKDKRPSANEFHQILSGKSVLKTDPVHPRPRKNEEENAVVLHKNEPGKGGFADVAGMENLKKDLTQRVIWILRDKEKALKYRLTPPNGMLLYGPPGCGKTFFAQKFAEESGFNYCLVNGSDLGSTYVHGTQKKIAELFKNAESNAPSVLCFDEFDSFVPSRGSEAATHRSDEVNEFLSQLNNCSHRGIFVIGTTNRIDMIDPAVLRKGRLDLHFEIPAPDRETRILMFKLHMKDRPQEEKIEWEKLSDLTDGYSAADIAFIVNESAMVAALSDQLISTAILEESIRCNPSSLLKKEVRKKIGF